MRKRPANIYQLFKPSGLTVLLILLTLALPSIAMAWPTDSQWIPLVQGGNPIQDDEADANGGVNVVPNDGSNPAAYIYNDGVYLYYRIRIDGSPYGGNDLFSQFGWGFEIDTDQNADDYEWLIMCDGISSPEVISLRENTDKTALGDPSDKAEYVAAEYPLVGNHQVTLIQPGDLDYTYTNGDDDYYLDFRLPYDVFKATTGITDNTLVRYFVGSSRSTNNLTDNGADLVAGSTLYEMASDYITPFGTIPPTMTFYDGTVRFVDDLDGFNDREVATAGDNVYVRVDDLDQTLDLNPAQTLKVILTTGDGDIETLILDATGVTGKFTGMIPSVQTNNVRAQDIGDGELDLLADDIVMVTYVDAITADGSQSVDRTDTLLIVSTGTDLTLSKTVDEPIPSEGDTIVYSLILTNNGPAATLITTVNDLLPVGVSHVSNNPSQGFYIPASGSWVVTGGLAVGASATLDITATVDIGASSLPQPIDNTATITFSFPADQYAGNNSATASINVGGTDFRVTKNVSDPGPNTGDNITYSVRIFNIGSNNGTNVVLTDLLPAGVAYVSDNPSQGSYVPGTGVWSVGNLNSSSGALLEITANVIAASGSTITNTASFTSADQPDTDPANNSASVDIQVGFIDLDINKTVNDPAPIENATVIYTLTVTNNGPNDATGVQITDNLPAGVTYFSDDGGGTYSGGVWTVGNLNNGSSATLNITATVDSGTAGQIITNTALVSAANEPDSDSSNDSDSATISIEGADLSIVKTVNNPTPGEGDTIIYTLTVTNNGPNDATGVVAKDILPGDRDAGVDGVTYVSHVASQGSYSITGGGRTYEWTVGDVAFGASATLTITCTVENNTGGTTVTNVAFITALDQLDYNNINDVSSADIAVDGTDLAITKTVDNTTPNTGDQVIYTVTVTNYGPIDATNIEVTDLLPPELIFSSAAPSQGAYASGTGIWTIGTIVHDPVTPSSTAATLDITATVQASASGLTITNNASISSVDQGDPDPANNSASIDIYVGGTDVSIAKIVDDPTPPETSTITYTITVTNNSSSNDATGVEVEDILPAGLTYVSDSPSQGSYAAGLWLVGTLSSGTSATLDLLASIDLLTAGSPITNTATIINLDQVDPNSTNNSASVPITPRLPPDLAISKTHSGSFIVGQNGDFTISVRNAGLGFDDGLITVTDNLPAGLTYVSAVGSGWTCGAAGQLVTCTNPGPLAAGASLPDITLTVSIGAAAAPATTNTATVSSTTVDIDPLNNSDTDLVTMFAPASGNKPLYVHTDPVRHSMSRIPGDTTTDNELLREFEAPEVWTITQSLQAPLTVDGSAGLPVYLNLNGNGVTGNRAVTITLSYDDGGLTPIGSPVTVNGNLDASNVSTWLFNISDAGIFTIPQNANIILTVSPDTLGDQIRLFELDGAAANPSRIDFNCTTVININSVDFYDAAWPGGAIIASADLSDTVYIRAEISDPFGFYDITSATIDIYQPDSTLIVDDGPVTILGASGSGANITAEYSYVVPPLASSYGTWTAIITANEGSEGNVSHSLGNTILVRDPSAPELSILKVADVANISPGGLVNYTITITNTSTAQANNIVITDVLSPYIAFGMVSQAGSPFTFTETIGSFPVGFFGTPEFSISGGPFGPPPATPPDYNSSITAYRIPMNGLMDSGAQFTIQYQVQVK